MRVCAVLAAVLAAGPAVANDSTAELDNNGLRLLQEPDIAMTSEDLSISPQAVHVEYEFVNRSAAAKTVTIAFPMPDVTGGIDENVGLPDPDSDDPFHFRVAADGVEIRPKLTARAFVGAADVTDRLLAVHAPLTPFAKSAGETLDRLPQAEKDAFVKAGLAAIDEYSTRADGVMEKHLAPTWTWRAAYVWTQTFAAGKPVHVVQDYAPSVGGTAGTSIGSAGWRTADYMRDYPAKYCIDEAFEAAVKRATAAAHADYAPFTEMRINYVLKTGANWAAPIGAFRLTVDKGAPANLVSFCADGVAKVGPTRFEARKSDYRPLTDLHILILQPIKN
jgi:hypothetical protein